MEAAPADAVHEGGQGAANGATAVSWGSSPQQRPLTHQDYVNIYCQQDRRGQRQQGVLLDQHVEQGLQDQQLQQSPRDQQTRQVLRRTQSQHGLLQGQRVRQGHLDNNYRERLQDQQFQHRLQDHQLHPSPGERQVQEAVPLLQVVRLGGQHPPAHQAAAVRPHVCGVCGAEFRSEGDVVAHLDTHSAPQPYQCGVCLRQFGRRAELRLHSKTHAAERRLDCNVCAKVFGSKRHLLSHLRTHSGQTPFECTCCPESFRRMGDLKKHLPSHSSRRAGEASQSSAGQAPPESPTTTSKTLNGEGTPFKCSLCPKSFRRSDHLKRHLPTHSGRMAEQASQSSAGPSSCQPHPSSEQALNGEGKSFKCSVCRKGFRRPDHLKRHLLIHSHQPVKVSQSSAGRTRHQSPTTSKALYGEGKSFKCSVCCKSFKRPDHLKRHLLIHSRQPLEAPQSSAGRALLRPHSSSSKQAPHGNKAKPFKCPVCPMSFKHMALFQHHLSMHRPEGLEAPAEPEAVSSQKATRRLAQAGARQDGEGRDLASGASADATPVIGSSNEELASAGRRSQRAVASQELVSQELVSQELVRQELVGQKLVSQELVRQKLVGQEPVHQEPVRQEIPDLQLPEARPPLSPQMTTEAVKQPKSACHAEVEPRSESEGGGQPKQASEAKGQAKLSPKPEAEARGQPKSAPEADEGQPKSASEAEPKSACEAEEQSKPSSEPETAGQPKAAFEAEGQPFRCAACGQRFAEHGSLEAHLLAHIDRMLFAEDTRGGSLLKPNQRAGPPAGKFRCTVCGKRLCRRYRLYEHLRMHTRETGFKCSHCFKRFGNKTDLARHALLHTGGKPFNCSFCGKTFARKEHRNKHLKLHTGEGCFKCSLCSERFRDRSDLKRHAFRIHN